MREIPEGRTIVEDDTEHYEPQRIVSPWTSPSRGAWGWAPGHPYTTPDIPGGAGLVVYLVAAGMLGLTLLLALWVFGVFR